MNDLNLTRNRCGVPRGAFTLVEVLVVLVLISILSGMVMTAVQGVTNSARIARTRSVLAIVDSVLQEQYESFKYRPLPVAIPDYSMLPNPDQEAVFGYEVMPSEAARVRLNMLRDLQRMELPDRISDILVFDASNNKLMNRPAEIVAAVSPVVKEPESFSPPRPERIRRDNRKESRLTARVDWFGMGVTPNVNDVPSRFASYFRRALPTWTEQHQGSECLYLILASTYIGGAPAIEMIPANNIGDTDGDGMLEILDGWGRPIEFVRWPSGFQNPELTPAEVAAERLIEDDFDLFRSDFGFIVKEQIDSIAFPDIVNIDFPWSLRPLVISAGSDGEFGIQFSPLNSGGLPVHFRYHSASPGGLQAMTWPVNFEHMGEEFRGRSTAAPYFFVDPYLRLAGIAMRPGSPIPGLHNVRADNITNYQLAASE